MRVLEHTDIATLDFLQGTPLLIEAGAGTGKTYTLASIFLRLVLDGHSPRRIGAITFTNAATDELRARLRARLGTALRALRDDQPLEDEPWWPIIARARDRLGHKALLQRLVEAMTDMDEAPVSTIHAFCLRLLSRHPGSTALPVALDTEADDRHLEALRDWWRRRPAQDDLVWRILSRREKPKMDIKSPETLDRRLHAARQRHARPLVEEDPDTLRASLERAEAEMREQAARLEACLETELESFRQFLIDHRDQIKKNSYSPHDEDWWQKKIADPLTAWQIDPLNRPFPEHLTRARLESAAIKREAEALFDALEASGLRLPRLAEEWNENLEALNTLRGQYAEALLGEALTDSTQRAARLREQAGIVTPDDLLRLALEAVSGEAGARMAGELDCLLVDEFQDTDALQYGIFARLNEKGLPVLFIGDPKQAIYAFRGADLAVYLQARNEVPKTHRLRLTRNFRSRQAVCDAVNALFAHPAPFASPDLDHPTIESAAHRAPALAAPEDLDPAPERGMILWPLDDQRARIGSKDTAAPIAAASSATHIRSLLDAAAKGKAHLGDAPVRAADIAILVPNHDFGQQMREALAARGIPCAYGGGGSVFGGEVAADLLAWLEALAEPENPGLLKRALATPLAGLTLDALHRALEADWAGWLERLDALAEVWRRQGVLAALIALLETEGILDLAARPNGERLLTDYLHLAELLQREAARLDDPVALARWLRQRIEEPDSADEHQLRLESEENAVRILTIHAAKGLEFPVVYLPFLWDSKPVNSKRKTLEYHDEAGHWRVSFLNDARRRIPADHERLAEELRLLYVALTRARSKLFAWVAPVGQGACRTALSWLLLPHAPPDAEGKKPFDPEMHRQAVLEDRELLELPVEHWWDALDALVATHDQGPALAASCFPADDTPLASSGAPVTLLDPASLPDIPLDPWRVTSYSGIVRGEHRRVDHDAEDLPDETIAATVDREHFPPGAATGNFLHRLLEIIDYRAPDWTALAPLLDNLRRRHGLPNTPGWQTALRRWMDRVLATPLPEGIALRDLAPEDRLHEAEFHFRVRGARGRDLDELLRAHGYDPQGDWSPRDNRLAGLLTGAIDLVYRHDGRYYIADFKSNLLDDYALPGLERAMRERRYDLQYLIYTLALHRHLRLRLPGYDPDRHLGGVRYLFLRGMDERGHGIYAVEPPLPLIEALDDCLEQGLEDHAA